MVTFRTNEVKTVLLALNSNSCSRKISSIRQQQWSLDNTAVAQSTWDDLDIQSLYELFQYCL